VVPEDVALSQAKRTVYRLGELFVASRCAAVVSVSAGLARSLKAPRVFLRTKHWTIPNGLKAPAPTRDRSQVRSDLGVGSSEVLVGTVARLNRQKGTQYSWRRLHTCDEPTHACVPLS